MDKDIQKELEEIGFRGFEQLRKENRDGKKRYTWTAPLINHDTWFTVILVEEGEKLLIEFLENPLKQSFPKNDIPGLLHYIKTSILNRLAATEI